MKTIPCYYMPIKSLITILFLQLSHIAFGTDLSDSTHIRKGVWGNPPNDYVFKNTNENNGYFAAFPWKEISEKMETEDLIIEYWVFTSVEDAEMAVVERLNMSSLFLGNMIYYPLPAGPIGDNCWQSFSTSGSVLFIRNNILVFIMPGYNTQYDAKSIETRARNIDLIISQQKKVYSQNEIPAPVVQSFLITSELPKNIDNYVDIKIIANSKDNQKLFYRKYATGFGLVSETGNLKVHFNKNTDLTEDSTKVRIKIWVWNEDHFVASAEQDIPF